MTPTHHKGQFPYTARAGSKRLGKPLSSSRYRASLLVITVLIQGGGGGAEDRDLMASNAMLITHLIFAIVET